jgi:hypothetical protein
MNRKRSVESLACPDQLMPWRIRDRSKIMSARTLFAYPNRYDEGQTLRATPIRPRDLHVHGHRRVHSVEE